MFEVLGGLFAAGASGGFLGMFGGLVRKGLDIWEERDRRRQDLAILNSQQEHELKMRDKDREMLEAEAKAEFAITEMQTDGAIEAQRLKTLGTAFETDRAQFATGELAANSPWFIAVDVLRGAIRPLTTILYEFAVLALFIIFVVVLEEPIKALLLSKDPGMTKAMMDLLTQVVQTILFIASTTISYWFVGRGSGNPPAIAGSK